jgi:hypothetical protein
MGDIDLKVISAAENSNKFQKNRFWKEKSVEDVITLGPTALATLVVHKSAWSNCKELAFHDQSCFCACGVSIILVVLGH